MDAVELLKQDHQKVKGIFAEYRSARYRAYEKKRKLADQAILELQVHSTLEEESFYPADEQRGGKGLSEFVSVGEEEHHVAEMLMDELKGVDVHNEQFDPKFHVLTTTVEHHIEEEKGEVLPGAAKALGPESDALGTRLEERRQQLMTEMAGASR
jgi:hypothetical protein